MIAPEEIQAKFSTNSFASNPYAVIVIGGVVGMTLMFLGIMLGAPDFVCLVLLLGGIGLAFGFGIGKVQYSISRNRIEQKIRRFIPYALKGKEGNKNNYLG